MGHIIIGMIVVVVGALITIYSEWFYTNFGTIPFFDKYLGTEGGGRLGYKLIGIFTSVIGFLIMTNLIGGVLLWIFGSMFSGFTQE